LRSSRDGPGRNGCAGVWTSRQPPRGVASSQRDEFARRLRALGRRAHMPLYAYALLRDRRCRCFASRDVCPARALAAVSALLFAPTAIERPHRALALFPPTRLRTATASARESPSSIPRSRKGALRVQSLRAYNRASVHLRRRNERDLSGGSCGEDLVVGEELLWRDRLEHDLD